MIPALISRTHIAEAVRRIHQDGIPARRRSRGFCLVTEGGHLPPKYAIALAHQAATGEALSSDRFSGGAESNDFLERLGFVVAECSCGGTVRDSGDPYPPDAVNRRRPTVARKKHSERCPECKRRVREMLERIHGSCLSSHAFRWPTSPDAYHGTSIGHALRKVAAVLQSYRTFGIADFVRRRVLARCDFWVPNPGFIVEFDESQHFTIPRKLALEAYADGQPLGFSPQRWMALCEQHNARDNNPPFRDEQRAWYDALRDLVPPTKGLRPTVRLYARDAVWCSLDPNNPDDRDRFSNLIHHAATSASRPATENRPADRPKSTLHVAMVFPTTDREFSNGEPSSAIRARQPLVPTADAFAVEAVDFVLFPEGYIRASDNRRAKSLRSLASELDAPLLVGAIDDHVDASGRAYQVLLRFDPDGATPSRLYVKHSTAEAIAFEWADWEPRKALPTFELGDVRVGATICHDSYLGLLSRYLAKVGARIWINPSFDNVTDIKWSSVLRLRAVENRFFSLCTLHCDPKKRKTHPFGFSPSGHELSARKAGSEIAQPLSECNQGGNIYIVDLDTDATGNPVEWSKLPSASKPRRARTGQARKPVCVSLRGGRPALLGRSGWEVIYSGRCVETDIGLVYAGAVPKERMLDADACFRVLDHANRMNAAPIIWNHWERLPTDSDRLAMLMMGRAIECCAPILISDEDGIRELVELSNKNKIPARRDVEPSGEVIVDIGYAWGLNSAFRMVAARLPPGTMENALDRYRGLG